MDRSWSVVQLIRTTLRMYITIHVADCQWLHVVIIQSSSIIVQCVCMCTLASWIKSCVMIFRGQNDLAENRVIINRGKEGEVLPNRVANGGWLFSIDYIANKFRSTDFGRKIENGG